MLDLLASIDHGFTTVERVVTRSAESSGKEGRFSGEAGSANWFGGMLKIGFSAEGKANRARSNQHEREGDRFHTPGSLLHRLRTLLLQQSLLTCLESDRGAWEAVQVSDFVEFRASITPNPFGNAIKTIINSVNFLTRVQAQTASQPALAGKSGNRPPQTKKQAQLKDDPFMHVLEVLHADLEQSESQALLLIPSGGARNLNYSAVATISTSHLRVGAANELSSGEFRVLGHVTRHLQDGGETSINILRGSVVGALAESQVETIVSLFNEQLEAGGWRVEPAYATIPAPALQLFPVAIYT